MKKLTYNAMTTHQEVGVPRKPFAPILPVNNMPTTPSKHIVNTFEENKSPNVMLTPKTPMAVQAPMQVADTPVPPTCLIDKAVAKVVAPVEQTEYSFEERRLVFYLSR